MKKLNSRGFAHWIVPMIVVLIIGAIGGYLYLRSSSAATTSLTGLQCRLLGRPYSSPTCGDGCVTGAGTYVTSAPTYNYCSKAVSPSVQGTACTGRGRRLTVGGNGCARRWQQTDLKGAIQCSDSTATYTVSTIDYCSGAGSGTTSTPSGSIIVGSMSPVGGGYGGETNCVSFVKWVLLRHTNAYDGRATGNGGSVAGTLRAAFGWKNIRAPHAVVSLPNSSGWDPGHTAIVDTVHSDGSIVVEESNWYGHYDTRSISAALASGYSYAYSGSDWH